MDDRHTNDLNVEFVSGPTFLQSSENEFLIKDLKLLLRNTSRVPHSIARIQIKYPSGLLIGNGSFPQLHVLKPEENVEICIGGKVIEEKFFLTIEIDVKQTNNKIVSVYKNVPIKITFNRKLKVNELTIPGIKPESHFRSDVVILKQYHIPNTFLILLESLHKKYPEFLERQFNPNALTSKYKHFNKLEPNVDEKTIITLFFSECATFLKTPTKLTKSNNEIMLHTLLYVEEFQMTVDIHVYDRKDAIITHTGTVITKRNGQKFGIYKLEVPGLAESKPSLLKFDSVYVKLKESHRHKYQGVIHRVMERHVLMAFDRVFENIHVRNAKNQKFFVEFSFNRRPLRVQHQAIELMAKHSITSYFFPTPQKSKSYIAPPPLNLFNRNLNEEQQRAVRNILVAKGAPYLIFGPPGTGKTVTIVEAVFQIWRNQPNAKVLICTPSNDAADVIADRLLAVISNKPDICRFVGYTYSESKRKYFEADVAKILKHKIIISTIINAARLVNGGAPPGAFAFVFIDESGYATETESITPIAGILSSANSNSVVGQVVLAGDPKQLGPRIHSNFNKSCGFGRSMLERLLTECGVYKRPYDERYITKLLVNYRSHDAILKIPNELFYHDELVANNSGESQLFVDWDGLKKPKFPVIFHNVVGEDKKDPSSPSFSNEKEIKIVMEYISKLVGERKMRGVTIREEHIGVITPYRRQIERIQNECDRNKWKKIRIGSVQQFQGKECLIIIISTVRTMKNYKKYMQEDCIYDLGFLGSPKRFNVAMTRPKALLIVVGDGQVLQKDFCWRKFIAYCNANDSFVGSKLEEPENAPGFDFDESLFGIADEQPSFAFE